MSDGRDLQKLNFLSIVKVLQVVVLEDPLNFHENDIEYLGIECQVAVFFALFHFEELCFNGIEVFTAE